MHGKVKFKVHRAFTSLIVVPLLTHHCLSIDKRGIPFSTARRPLQHETSAQEYVTWQCHSSTMHSDCGATSQHTGQPLHSREARTTPVRLPVTQLFWAYIVVTHNNAYTLTCDSVLFVCVCFRAWDSGDDGVSYRERLGGHELELKCFTHSKYVMHRFQTVNTPSILLMGF